MFCSKCGRELPDDARFCIGCGATVTASASADMAQSYKTSFREPQNDESKEDLNYDADDTIKDGNEHSKTTPSLHELSQVSPKNWWITLILLVLFRGLCIHRFYAGKIKSAVFFMLLDLFSEIVLFGLNELNEIEDYLGLSLIALFGLIIVGIRIIIDLVLLIKKKFTDVNGLVIKQMKI